MESDATISYINVMEENYYSTDIKVTESTKLGAITTNIVCGKSTDSDVSTVGSESSKTGVVGSDASENENGSHHHNCTGDATLNLESVVSCSTFNATSIDYMVPHIYEDAESTACGASESVAVPEKG